MKTFREQLRELATDRDEERTSGCVLSEEQFSQIERAVLDLVWRAMPEVAEYWTNEHGFTRRDSYAEKAYRKGRDEYYEALVKAIKGS